MITGKTHLHYDDGIIVHVRDGRGVLEFVVAGGGYAPAECADLERRLAAGQVKPHEITPADEDQKLTVIQRTSAGPGAHWADLVDDEGDWLRHHPTQVIVYKHGRSDAVTLAHMADMLAQHGMITEDERASAHAAAAGT